MKNQNIKKIKFLLTSRVALPWKFDINGWEYVGLNMREFIEENIKRKNDASG